jgi:hypothetical protein
MPNSKIKELQLAFNLLTEEQANLLLSLISTK